MLFASCSNTAYKGSEVVIEEPSFIEESSGEKSLYKATPNIDKYMLKMEPAWDPENTEIVGNTNGYVEVQPPFNNLGFFEQGIWDFTLLACSRGIDGKDVEVYKVSKRVEINSDSVTIPISASEILPANPNVACKVTLADFDFLAPGPSDKYGEESDYGYRLSYVVYNLEKKESYKSGIIAKDSISGSTIGSNGVLIGDDFQSGTYGLSVFLDEYVGGKWVHTGGTSMAFVTVPGIEIYISGSEDDAIDLFPNDYVTPGLGDSGIIVDQGTPNTVEVTASKGTTDIDSKTSVSVKDEVTFKAVVLKANNEEVTVQNGMWLVDGEPVKGETGSSFTYTVPDKKGKTLTITYMFLDSTSYNTISGNFYLSVSSN